MKEVPESDIRSRNYGKYLQSHFAKDECHVTQVKVVKCTHGNLLERHVSFMHEAVHCTLSMHS
jgi:hypothetical protein